jgi:hypothetical protein
MTREQFWAEAYLSIVTQTRTTLREKMSMADFYSACGDNADLALAAFDKRFGKAAVSEDGWPEEWSSGNDKAKADAPAMAKGGGWGGPAVVLRVGGQTTCEPPRDADGNPIGGPGVRTVSGERGGPDLGKTGGAGPVWWVKSPGQDARYYGRYFSPPGTDEVFSYVEPPPAVAANDDEPDGSDGIQFATREQAMVWAMERMWVYARKHQACVSVYSTGMVCMPPTASYVVIEEAARAILEGGKG